MAEQVHVDRSALPAPLAIGGLHPQLLPQLTSHAGHVSLGQLKVMSAIERCRTAALGRHVERCEERAYLRISYNSCRNRHCPKCQAAAAKECIVIDIEAIVSGIDPYILQGRN